MGPRHQIGRKAHFWHFGNWCMFVLLCISISMYKGALRCRLLERDCRGLVLGTSGRTEIWTTDPLPMIPHLLVTQPFPVSASGVPSPSSAPVLFSRYVLCWYSWCRHHNMETLTVPEYPLQLDCQMFALHATDLAIFLMYNFLVSLTHYVAFSCTYLNRDPTEQIKNISNTSFSMRNPLSEAFYSLS